MHIVPSEHFIKFPNNSETSINKWIYGHYHKNHPFLKSWSLHVTDCCCNVYTALCLWLKYTDNFLRHGPSFLKEYWRNLRLFAVQINCHILYWVIVGNELTNCLLLSVPPPSVRSIEARSIYHQSMDVSWCHIDDLYPGHTSWEIAWFIEG